ncbi:MAG: hypothetical protein ACP5I3_11995, partial [Thermoproteus sp.]
MGNYNAAGNPPDIPDEWVLESCYEFEGPLPLLFVSWGAGVWNSGVSSMSINIGGPNYAEAGSGFYASYEIYNSTGSYVISAASSGPTWTFPQYTAFVVYSPLCGATGTVAVQQGNQLGIYCEPGGVPTYTVPSSGTLFLGPTGDIAAVTFYDCLAQTGACTPIYIANGTMVLDVTSYSSSTLYLYPYIDIGNGTITNTFSVLINQDLIGQSFNILDGQLYYYNPALGYVVETSPCSNAPTATQVTTSYVSYTLQNIINVYHPGIPGWAVDIGGTIAEALAEVLTENEALAHFAGFLASYILSYLEESTSSAYRYVIVKVVTNP